MTKIDGEKKREKDMKEKNKKTTRTQRKKKEIIKDIEGKEEFGKSERRKATTIEKREEIGKNEKGRKEI